MNKKIFIIEDEILIARAIVMDLEDAGFTVTGTAASVDNAISAIEAQRPDIVLTDINLNRDKDGIDGARWINKFDKSIQIIFMTGYGYDSVMDRIAGIRYISLLEKPVNAHTIVESIGA